MEKAKQKDSQQAAENIQNEHNSHFTKQKQSKRADYYDLIRDLVQPSTVESIKRFWKEKQTESIASIILLIGLFLIPLNVNLGGAVVGLISGFYLSRHILDKIGEFPSFYRKEGGFKSYLVSMASLCAFLIVPGFMTSMIVGSIVRYFVNKRKKKHLEDEAKTE